MKLKLMTVAAMAAFAAVPAAKAGTVGYNVFERFYEPDTQPSDSIFIGTFDYDAATHAVTNLKGRLSESMTGGTKGYPDDTMTWLDLNNQLVSWHDATLHGTFAAVFKNTDTKTFWTGAGDDWFATHPTLGAAWHPSTGVDAGGVYYGFPKPAKNPGNAYALIFVPDDPLAPLTPAQLNKLAYADCAPGGMMGAVCMTGTTVAGYGSIGTMSGYPVAQVITRMAVPVPVPEPETYAMMLAGLGVLGGIARRRRRTA